ncbi:hypothetical protein [Agrobacterium tumefaciens]|uniref:hypothetical protein n=1 Tax=Agrobacterium tumefaciens TaxID=358 RepID=UPI001574C390|nr:hypothetical protein [Agrobacterium tumefaciens]
MANFGIGLGAFADGMMKGVNMVRSIRQDEAAQVEANDRKRLRDLQFKRLEQEDSDQQAFRNASSSAASDAKTQRAADVSAAMTPNADGTWRVGEKTYNSEADANKAAETQVGTFMDYYLKTSVPKMQEHWASTGQVEKAQALGKWLEDENVKKGMKHWASAVRSFQTGDSEGFKTNLMSAYNQQGYFEDGRTATGIEDLKNDKGQLLGYRIKFKDGQGNETSQDYDGEDVAKLALNALSPAQVLSYGMDQLKASSAARSEIAKEQRGLMRDVAKEDRAYERDVSKIGIQQQNTLESQANQSQLRMAEETEKNRTGQNSTKVRDANAIADALRANGKDEKYIQSVYPQLLGVERGSKSETDRLDGYIAAMARSDLDFAGLPVSQQVARAREMMQAVDGARGGTEEAVPATKTESTKAAPKGIPLWDSKTNTLIYR